VGVRARAVAGREGQERWELAHKPDGPRAKENPCLRRGFRMSSAPENPKQIPSPEREPRWEMPMPPEAVRYPPPLWQWLCIVAIVG
jgi:hypothetical protein